MSPPPFSARALWAVLAWVGPGSGGEGEGSQYGAGSVGGVQLRLVEASQRADLPVWLVFRPLLGPLRRWILRAVGQPVDTAALSDYDHIEWMERPMYLLCNYYVTTM